ncbi:Outer membrane protein assembly factor BamA [Magnetospirillum sp. LM-5]|uniref:outer membrane protein assembly factor BamA n=1 Tax=Magnetospirillum sp. LM-5 TaxID=2681466 RepID=UPI0013829BC6|nr:outer membrane protein assembly factor BamA [Magnetospirillum sp. LM-5]CAA7620459.1 Outer membrane protein assembly factor BamA [Magnetospirillum sp. LM-5]
MGLVRKTALALGLIAAVAPAMAQESGRVRQIVVQGTQRVEVETVKSYMAIAEGDPYNSDRIDRSLKALFNTGLFADVAIRREGDAVVVKVVENPIINRIAYEGNKRVKDEELQQETQLRPRVVYTRTKVQNDVKRMLDLYRRQGRFAATVEPKIIQLEQNRVDLAYEINEGEPTYVKRINFVGNKFYSDSRLREVLSTKEERWYRFLSSDDTYDPDRLTYDRELMRRYYLKHGFADFRVVSGVAELTPDREGFFITFTVEEGDRYKFGAADIKVALKDLTADELKANIDSQTGEWYNADQVEDIVQRLTDAVGTKGYAFVDVKPQIQRDRENKVVNVTYEIQEGPRVYVERIDITGNVRTLDKVIRREFRLVEGDAFNTAKVRRSRQRVKDLAFFEKVEVTNVPSETSPDKTIIKVDVAEKSTGELMFGIGWSSQAGPLLESSLRERNLLGKGQDLKVSGQLGTRRTSAELSFTEPYFLDRNLAAGFDLFSITRKMQRESSYDSNTTGTALRAGYNIHENLRQDIKYMIKRDQVENIKSTASTYVQEQLGSSMMSSIQQTLLWDYRDSRIEPTEGYYFRINNEFAGLGGTQKFIRNNFGAGKFFPIDEGVVFSLTGNAGFMNGWGDNKIRITERYYLGGETLRGFEPMGVSPRDSGSGDALGGLWQYHGTAQLKFPLGLPQEFGVAGQVFTDVGSIGETESYTDKTGINQASSVRASVGTGISWKSPMGPVAVDLAVPVMKEAFDKDELFRFSFGTRF